MEWVRLGDIAEIRKGKKVDECQANVNTVRYIQIEDLRHNDDMKFTCDPKAVMADSEDVLIAWDGANAGTVGFDLEGAIGSTISKISIKENKKKELLPQYLGIFLQSKEDFLRQTTTGATIPHINKQALVQLAVPLFTLEIQNRIIELNNNLGSIIAKRREQIDALDALVSSVFYELIFNESDEKIPLGELMSDFLAGKSLAGEKPSQFRVLKTSCVYSGYFDENEWKFLPVDYKPKEEHIVKSGDILVSRMNTEELVGASAYVDKNYDDLAIPDRLWILRTNEGVSPVFLWKFFQTDLYRGLISRIATGTSGSMKNISKKNFSQIQVPLPKLEVQNRFADYVTSIEAQKESLRTSLAELETLFDALMQAAFSGHLNQS